MSNFCPRTGAQVRFLRADPTGRINPISKRKALTEDALNALMAYFIGSTFGGILAYLLYLGC